MANGEDTPQKLDLSAGVEAPAAKLDLSAGMDSVQTAAPPPEQEVATSRGLGVLTGFGKGVLDTTAGIGSLIQKIPGIGPKIIPQEGLVAEQKMAEAQTTSEKVGKFAENIAEFASGDEVLTGLGKLAKIGSKFPEILELAEKYPKITKLLTGAGKGAAIGGTQAGVKSGGDIGETTAGAIGGGVGGAAGEAIAMAPQAVKTVGKLMGFGLTSEEALVKAGRPAVSEGVKFVKALDTAHPIIEKINPNKIKSVGDFVDVLGEEAQNIRKTQFGPMIDRNGKQMLSAHSVADNIVNAVTPQMEEYEPAVAKEIKDFAVRFRKDMPLAKAEADLQYFNKQLAGYYKMGARDASRAAELEPQIAKYEAAADGMRDLIYNKLRDLGEKAPEELQRQYGALKDLERVFAKRATVADRQAPINLPQALALMGGALESGVAMLAGEPRAAIAGAIPIIATTAAKYRNASESLIRQGIRAAKPAGMVSKAVTAAGPAVSAVVKTAAPVAGEEIGRDTSKSERLQFRASDGSVHEIPSNFLDAARKIDPNLQIIPRQ